MSSVVAVDLFCGVGGLTHGLQKAVLGNAFFKYERGVRTTKSERIAHGITDFFFAGFIGYIIQIKALILIFIIDRWRHNVMVDDQSAKYGFNTPCSSEKVTGHGFGRTDR